MRIIEEQLAGLNIVAQKVMAAVCNCWLHHDPGDVAYLCTNDPSTVQIVYADGGYDVWDGQNKILFSDVSAERAAEILINEYKENKINIVMTRILGSDWRAKEHQKELAYVASEVWNTENEKKRSYQKLEKELKKHVEKN
jgi:hypothetical protein